MANIQLVVNGLNSAFFRELMKSQELCHKEIKLVFLTKINIIIIGMIILEIL